MSRKYLVVGNWKMNGSKKFVDQLIKMVNKIPAKSKFAEVCIAPPFVYARYVRQKVKKKIHVAAQNCFTIGSGAYTGETSPDMLKDIGITWVIVGHSERRGLFCEGEALIGAKLRYALDIGMTVVVCLGESLDQKDSGHTLNVLTSQVRTVVDNTAKVQWERVVLAYEPIWALGSGKTVTTEEIEEVHKHIREYISANIDYGIAHCVRIIYGGIVNTTNCRELAVQPNVDGFLVGASSLQPDFISIVDARTNKKRKGKKKKVPTATLR